MNISIKINPRDSSPVFTIYNLPPPSSPLLPLLILILTPRYTPFIGLFLIAVGTGGIKPCVAPFGGDQFESHQVCLSQVKLFFSRQCIKINM